MTTATRVLGIGSALLSAAAAIAWFVTFVLQDVIGPVPDWQVLDEYALALTSESSARLLYIYPSLILAMTFVIMLVCVHQRTREDHRVWSLTALAIGLVYASVATINYNIQAVAVRASLAVGQTAGIEMFLPDNPNSIFGALANSYVYMSLAMVALGFAFQPIGLGRIIRWLLFAQVLTAAGQLGATMFGLAEGVFIATSFIWVIGAPAAFALIAIDFWRVHGSQALPEGRTRQRSTTTA